MKRDQRPLPFAKGWIQTSGKFPPAPYLVEHPAVEQQREALGQHVAAAHRLLPS